MNLQRDQRLRAERRGCAPVDEGPEQPGGQGEGADAREGLYVYHARARDEQHLRRVLRGCAGRAGGAYAAEIRGGAEHDAGAGAVDEEDVREGPAREERAEARVVEAREQRAERGGGRGEEGLVHAARAGDREEAGLRGRGVGAGGWARGGAYLLGGAGAVGGLEREGAVRAECVAVADDVGAGCVARGVERREEEERFARVAAWGSGQ